jgi:hypothetical protein
MSVGIRPIVPKQSTYYQTALTATQVQTVQSMLLQKLQYCGCTIASICGRRSGVFALSAEQLICKIIYQQVDTTCVDKCYCAG